MCVELHVRFAAAHIEAVHLQTAVVPRHDQIAHLLCGRAVVRSYGRAVVRLCGRAVVRLFGRSVVRLFGCSVVRLFGRSREG